MEKLEDSLEQAHQKIFYGTLLECLAIVFLSVFQICYLRRILEKKQVI